MKTHKSIIEIYNNLYVNCYKQYIADAHVNGGFSRYILPLLNDHNEYNVIDASDYILKKMRSKNYNSIYIIPDKILTSKKCKYDKSKSTTTMSLKTAKINTEYKKFLISNI